MKGYFHLITAMCMLSGCMASQQQTPVNNCHSQTADPSSYSKKDTIEKLIHQYSAMGIPGLVVAVDYGGHYWSASAGFAKIETAQPLQTCHLQYLQSISKTFLAVAILMLAEENKISLDSPITQYLPQRYCAYLPNAPGVSVRNLLNHESGIPEYSDVPEYILFLLQHPDHYFSSEELLRYIAGKKQQFQPGTRYSYVNTNYHLLALIADSIAGDHASLIRQRIFTRLHLGHTFYKGGVGLLDDSSLVNSYLDRFSDGRLENVSMMQRVSVSCSKGDDGIVCSPTDAITFLKALDEGKLLNSTSMHEMKKWVTNKEGRPMYGMGLFHVDHKGHTGFGHGGAGIGAGCGLYCFPDKKIYIFLATNMGTLIDGPAVQKVEELKSRILDAILEDEPSVN